MSKETEAATASLADYIGYDLPLPQVAQQALEWHLKQGEDAKEKLAEELLNCLYNKHVSYKSSVARALEGFDITEKG